ncbi:hypothetical protein [Pontibacter litorisediminis]|uniref:hypothetical protein n=1 Tax=Pontibacter litorisediminis TaxID=1846260 RepID=UPI0023ED0573|nr:hypothetical protein [Pontibacter litorisediminis]
MEGNYWNRNRDREEHNRRHDGDRRRVDEDSYRGAYRLDTTSDHRNETTWDGFGSTQRNRRSNDYNQDYNRDYNRNYNSDYNRNYNGPSRNRGYDHDNYNMDSRYRDQGNKNYRSSNNADWNDQSRYGHNSSGYDNGNRKHRSVHARIEDHDPYGAGNFNGDYRPDHYGQGGGENYGNKAGSLSYGYDGSSNYDPDWNSRYDPVSGKRRSYHGFYTSRHPDQDQYQENASRNRSRFGYDNY